VSRQISHDAMHAQLRMHVSRCRGRTLSTTPEFWSAAPTATGACPRVTHLSMTTSFSFSPPLMGPAMRCRDGMLPTCVGVQSKMRLLPALAKASNRALKKSVPSSNRLGLSKKWSSSTAHTSQGATRPLHAHAEVRVHGPHERALQVHASTHESERALPPPGGLGEAAGDVTTCRTWHSSRLSWRQQPAAVAFPGARSASNTARALQLIDVRMTGTPPTRAAAAREAPGWWPRDARAAAVHAATAASWPGRGMASKVSFRRA